MEERDKELLLKDLCARLPYGTKVKYHFDSEPYTLLSINWNKEIVVIGFMMVDTYVTSKQRLVNIKPYLRPMSSMTEGEKKEFIEYAGYEIEESVNGRHYEYYLKDFCGTPDNPSVNSNGVDWLNKKMFDFRGLIDKGLAIEVTEENNPYKD